MTNKAGRVISLDGLLLSHSDPDDGCGATEYDIGAIALHALHAVQKAVLMAEQIRLRGETEMYTPEQIRTTSNYPVAILANHDGDHRAAYKYLAKAFLALYEQFADSVSSRFVEVGRFEAEDPIYVHKKTESQISSDVDMADCIDTGVMRKWFYADDNGEFQAITIGRQKRINSDEENPLYFATSAIVAGGKCVGEVVFTDH